jgi:hypothetical protein
LQLNFTRIFMTRKYGGAGDRSTENMVVQGTGQNSKASLRNGLRHFLLLSL